MKKKLLTTAVLAGIAGTAGAVNVNPDGLGQVGLFPYYTVQSGNSTLITITNTTGSAKAVKVRFLEGKNSREVLDFNLYLSKFDMWTGAISPDGTTGAKLTTADKTCTVPAIPSTGVTFRNFQYTGTNADGEDTSLARTREGHIEIIEMGVLSDESGTPSATSRTPFTPAFWATHQSGVPFSCSNLVNAWGSGAEWDTLNSRAISAPVGGLYAAELIINGAAGLGVSDNATMLDAFSNAQLHTAPGSLFPNLSQATPPKSIVFNNGTVVSTDWTGSSTLVPVGLNAVSATLMHQSVMNDYTVETGLAAATDWIVTFPTKQPYVAHPGGSGTTGLALARRAPFTTNFGAGGARPGTANPVTFPPVAGGACELVSLSVYDREEGTPTAQVDFSPQLGSSNSLCWETNVITFNNTNALGSQNVKLNVNPGFQNGWMRLTFSDPNHVLASNAQVDNIPNGRTYGGLPAIGFAVQNYVNNAVSAGVLANYGVQFDHRYTRSISP